MKQSSAPPMMNLDATDLSKLVREVLAKESVRSDGATPLYQPRTVPFIVPTGARPQAAQPAQDDAPSEPTVPAAERMQLTLPPLPEAKPAAKPRAKSEAKPVETETSKGTSARSAKLAVAAMGIVAFGAACAAGWFAQKKGLAVAHAEMPVAMATTDAPPQPETVRFVVPVRTTDIAPSTPAPQAAAPAVATPKSEPKPEPKAEVKAEPKPEPRATARAEAPRSPEPRAAEPARQKAAEKVAAAEEKKEEKKPAPTPSAPPSVDAILQQQLNSAFP